MLVQLFIGSIVLSFMREIGSKMLPLKDLGAFERPVGDRTVWSVAEGPRRAALFTPRLVLSRASSRWETKRLTDAAPSPVSEYPDVES